MDVSAGLSASDPSDWLPTDQADHLPTEPAWRSTRPGGADAVGRSARLLLGLLRLAGLWGGAGWRPLLYTALLYAAASAVCALAALADLHQGWLLLEAGLHWIRAFLLAAGLLESGQAALNATLAAAVTRREGADSGRRLLRAAGLQRRLSECQALLASAAAAELPAVMLLGVLTQIQMVVAARDMFVLGADPLSWLMLASYSWAALVALVGPCEAGERLLAGLARCRDLLLRLEELRPELAPRLERLQRALAADREVAADLGLYRLQRATLLSIWSAIITYIIVMLQFMGDAGDPSEGDAGSWPTWDNFTLMEQ
ncbi:hypothetical protein FJT64_023894 [Amphibalanus amphitrite]|uniref:Gustatory receptor n=1 Tax=Amphibalanus amphitrite TaxID=1232801 RepID=A0A6A4WQD4_AMPAM|nr:hypothetical protein FJT64_023894 [Amphibalanus amphitrite]